VIVPGAVFEVPHSLADPPQRVRQSSPPHRESRWVLVVSNKADCGDRYQETITSVLLSAKTEYQSRHDVLIKHPDGGVERDSIAQTDLVLPILKAELTDERFRGVVLRDTLRQVRAKLADALGISGEQIAG
jgi:hypothetical protein